MATTTGDDSAVLDSRKDKTESLDSPEPAQKVQSPSSAGAADSQHSVATTTGSASGDKEVKSKDSTGKTSKVQRFRRKTWIMLLASQAMLIALIIIEMSVLSAFVKKSKVEMASSNVELLEEMYNSKIHEMVKILEITAKSAQVQHLLIDGTTSNVNEQLQEAAAQLHFEYFALIDASNQVVASIPNSLVGQQFNPLNLASDMLASAEPTIATKNAVVPAADLMIENILTWRDTDIDGYVLKHPTDKSFESTGSALVRYVAAPVKDSSQNVVGVLIAGDIATGKHAAAEKTLKELGAGFVLIFHRTDEAGSSWKISQTVLATGFHTFDTGFESVDEAFLDKTVSNGESITTKMGVIVEQQKFAVAAKQIDVASGKAVLVVGYPQATVDDLFKDIIISTCLFTSACVIVDLMATFFSIRSFIDPLEKLVLLISTKNTKKIDDALANVNTSKNFIWRILLFSAASSALLAGMFVRNSQLLHEIFLSEGALGTQIRFVQNSFSLKIEEMISQSCSAATSDNMSSLLSAPTANLMTDIQHDLDNALSVFKIELAFVLDTNNVIVASAGGANLQLTFPSLHDEISDVIRNRKGMQFTGYLTDDVYRSFAAPEWKHESFASSLHPERSSKNVVARFVLTPILDSSGIPQGVLVYGDILNGKGFEIAQESVEFFNEGFAGIYWSDPETGQIELLSSYFHDTDSFDIELGSKSALQRVEQRRETALENKVEIVGHKVSIAVERVDPGIEFDVYSDNRKKSAKHDELVFLVRGTEYSAFKSMEQSQLALEIVSIILNAVFSVGVAVYTFVPIYKFSLRIKMQMSSKMRPSMLAKVGSDGGRSSAISLFRSFTKGSTGGSSRKDSIAQ